MSSNQFSPTKFLNVSGNSIPFCSLDPTEVLNIPFELSNNPFQFSLTPSAAPTTPSQEFKLPNLFDNNSVNLFNTIIPLTNSWFGLGIGSSDEACPFSTATNVKKEEEDVSKSPSDSIIHSQPPIFSLLSQSPPLSRESSNHPTNSQQPFANVDITISESSFPSPPLPSHLTPCNSPVVNTSLNVEVKVEAATTRGTKRKSDKASSSSSSSSSKNADTKKPRKQKSHILTNLPKASESLEKCGWTTEEIRTVEEWVTNNPQVFYSRSWRHKMVQFLATNKIFHQHVRWIDQSVLYVDNDFRSALDGLFQLNNARPESMTWIRSVFTVFIADRPREWTVLKHMKPYFNRDVEIEKIENTARGRRKLPLEKTDE